MPLPVRSLSVLQNWDCQGCTLCCRQYHVPVTPRERDRIEKQDWAKEPEFAGVPLFVKSGWFSSDYRLNHRADGACVFLGPDNRCRIHAKHGSEAKPLACRNYPFTLVPGGDHWKLGVRFTCPSAAASEGRPLSEHLSEARGYAAELEQESATGAIRVPAPPLQGNQRVPWGDVARIVSVVSELLTHEDGSSIERRWRKVLFLIDLMRKTTVGRERDPKKAITGGRLGELLEILAQAAEAETPESPAGVPPPGKIARTVFRLLAAFSTRQDNGPDRGPAQRTAYGRLSTAIRFVRGRGLIPRTHGTIGEVAFEQAEKPLGALPPPAEALLTRWSRVKIESGQFCGPTNFNFSVWDGLESLALSFATAMWLARVLKVGGRSVEDSVNQAVRIVDDSFGFNPFLARRQRIGLRLLALTRGELLRLVAWYGR